MTQINPNIHSYKAQPGFKAASALPFMPDMDNYGLNNGMPFPAELMQNQQYSDIPPVELPDIYYSPPSQKQEGFKERLKKADMLDVVVPWLDHPLLMLGTCLGINFGIDAISNSFNKEYSKSILGKSAKFGDKIEQSKFAQHEVIQKGAGSIKRGWSAIKKFAMKSDIIKAMVETPSMPENPMPKSELLKSENRILELFGENLKQFGVIGSQKMDGTIEYEQLTKKSFNLTKDVIKKLEQDFGGKTMAEVGEEKFLSRYIMKNSGFTEAEISATLNESAPLNATMEKLRSKLGGEAKLKEIIEGKMPNATEEAIKISEQLKGIKLKKGLKIPFTDIKILTREAGFQEVYNRLHSIGKGAATKTGQYMSKFVQRVYRGFTFGGGKTGVMLFIAPHIVHTLINTHKAENNEKVGTFMNGMISAVSWVFTFPLILKAIHALGGIQYTGMGKAKVDELKNEVAKFNKRVAAGEFKNFKAWKKAKNKANRRIKNLRRVENQDFVTKCLRKVSQFLKSDLLKFDRYKNEGFLKRFLHNTPATVKNFIWSAGRFAVFMFIGMPILDKFITKCINAIFGRNYDDTYEMENLKAKEKQKEFLKEDLTDRMYKAQAKKMGVLNQSAVELQTEVQGSEDTASTLPSDVKDAEPIVDETTPLENEPVQETSSAEENTLSQETKAVQSEDLTELDNIQEPAQTSVSQADKKRDNYTYIPSQENVIKRQEEEKVNKYIPAQTPVKVDKAFDNSGLDAALRRADLAETKALQILSGKFPD